MAVLKKYAPDLIGFQEYHRRWEETWPSTQDPDYAEMQVDRGDGEGLVLRWRKDRFTAVKTGHFWLGDDPDTPSTDWDDKYHKPRICAYALLEDKASGQQFLYMNVHYGFGAEGQVKNAALLERYARQLGDYPTIIAGDFNMTPGTAGYEAMASRYTDINMATDRCGELTFHGYGKNEARLLDYCFADSKVTGKSYTVLKDTFEGKYPSDHYGILMSLEISD